MTPTALTSFNLGGLLVLLLVAVAVLVVGKRLSSWLERPQKGAATQGGGVSLPYRRRTYLFSKAERSFYEVLRRAVGPEHCVFAKVRLSDLVSVPKGTPNWQAHFNRIQSKHIDFVVCDTELLCPLVAVELDDSSHAATVRQERDAFVDLVFSTAGLPLIRVPASRAYRPDTIRDMVNEAMGTPLPVEVRSTNPAKPQPDLP